MNSFSKKLISLVLTCIMLLSLSVPAFASETIVTSSNPAPITLNATNLTDAETPQVESRNAVTSSVKKAIRWALSHKSDLINTARKWIGDEAANAIDAAFDKAAPVLDDLLYADQLVWETVQDQLARVVGRDVAYWIRCALEWMI